MQGALSMKQCRASSLAIQVSLKHCFSGNYSRQFRPTAGDTTDCPCSFDPESHGLVAQPADQEGFD